MEAAATLRDRLAAASFPLPVAGREAAEATAAAVRQLDDYVIARLADLDAPALIVVGGSTGAGKSTLINSLLGTTVTRPGVLRPTTRAPVLVHHPSEADRFSGDRVLPALARVSGGHSDSTTELELVALAELPPTVALLDTPDIDSVVDANRELAAHLLAAADLWVFVTTAARYADAVPWQFLLDAQQRGVALVVVLNRVPPWSRSPPISPRCWPSTALAAPGSSASRSSRCAMRWWATRRSPRCGPGCATWPPITRCAPRSSVRPCGARWPSWWRAPSGWPPGSTTSGASRTSC
ncbi:MAG: dynamin family protein [Acidimicrobiales bacterium]